MLLNIKSEFVFTRATSADDNSSSLIQINMNHTARSMTVILWCFEI
jgi:hypothetical protein